MGLLFQSIVPDLVALAALFFTGLYLYFTRNFNFWEKYDIPHLKPTPFIGNMKDVFFQKLCIPEFLKNIYEKQRDKPYVGIIAFDRPALILNDLDLVKNVLVKDAHHFVNHMVGIRENVDPALSRLVIMLKNEKWRQMRSNVTQVFTTNKLKKMIHLVVKCMKELGTYIENVAAGGAPLDVMEIMSMYTTDLTSCCAFGIESNSLKNPNAEIWVNHRKMLEFSVLYGFSSMLMVFAPKFQNLLRLKVFSEEYTGMLRRIIRSAIIYREKNDLDRCDAVSCMIEMKKKGRNINQNQRSVDSTVAVDIFSGETLEGVVTTNRPWHTEEIATLSSASPLKMSTAAVDETSGHNITNTLRALSPEYTHSIDAGPESIHWKITYYNEDDFVGITFSFLFAGFEMAGCTLTYALYELALNPEIQNRLRAEITEVLTGHDQQVTYESIQQMIYLDMVVSETLRKYPVLGFLDRVCLKDYELPHPSGKGTFTLPAGTGVYIPLLGIHRDPEYYPNPDTFNPENFSEENKRSRHKLAFLPFGDGPRQCIGYRFTYIQVKSGLINILSRYEVAPCEETPVPLRFEPKSFILVPLDTVYLKFERIDA